MENLIGKVKSLGGTLKQMELEGFFKILSALLSFWAIHGVLRGLLLFRNNAYGNPFVAKPDWYIFHAICIDFIWIAEMALPFLLLALLLPSASKVRRVLLPFFVTLQGILLPFTLLDHEFCRFLGTHFSISLLDTYKDVSSLAMLWDYVAADQSVPYLQWVVLALMAPAAYFLWKLIYGAFARRGIRVSLFRGWIIGCVAFFGFSELFLKVIWTGTNRMRKLEPVVSIFIGDVADMFSDKGNLDPAYVKAATETARRVWAEIEGPDAEDYEYVDENYPLYRVPKVSSKKIADNSLQSVRPNFLVIFMESQRGMDVGYLNPDDARGSVTPVIDSLAREGAAWSRFYVGGTPTVGGVLSSHFGFPVHSSRSTATELANVNVPSFASVLRDSGYVTHFFAAADPAWDNLSVWFQKWYDRTHYDRAYEDDSTFFDVSAKFIRDSLAKKGKPFVASLITRSNHYPFNLVPGMSDEAKALSQADRMRYTMGWADRQLGRFINSLSVEPWFKDSYVIVLGDHGFPQGEHGVSAIGADGYSNASWIPFVMNGPGISGGVVHEEAASQSDISPTILALANVRVANSFLGHNLLRNSPKPFALGVPAGVRALSLQDLRVMNRKVNDGEFRAFNYKIDPREDSLLKNTDEILAVKRLADTLVDLNDWILTKNRVTRVEQNR